MNRIVLLVLSALLVLSGCAQKTEKPENEPELSIPVQPETEVLSMPETFAHEDSKKEPLPTRYDAREHGRAPQIQDQGSLGTCWAFASLLALESSLLPQEVWNFSEDHMIHNPNFQLDARQGGDYSMSLAYLLSWQGPVREEDDPYGDGYSPQELAPVKHLQSVRILPAADHEAIKRAVIEYGGVQSSLYTDMEQALSDSSYYNRQTSAYCFPSREIPNHDVVIMGWDDAFPAEAFLTGAESDGAFLCANSWGSDFGENGYFYVSYEDKNLGTTNISYQRVDRADSYQGIYQSDLCGWVGQIGYGKESVWAVNCYTAREEEWLSAVGFYATGPDTSYEIWTLTGPDVQPPAFRRRGSGQTGRITYAGYETVELAEPVLLKPGQSFGVMIRLETPGAVHPMAVEYDAGDGRCYVELGDGDGYISPDGVRWESAEEKQGCNLCLKAYTRK